MARPVVDRLRTSLLSSVTFVSVNVIEPGGYAIAQEYGLRGTPQFVYFDANGKEQWRKYGVPNEAEFRAALTPP
jgi:thioredoxin-related protein